MSYSTSDRTRQRRRIIKAAVSAPVIYTLANGATAAAASLSCRDKDENFLNLTGNDFESGELPEPDSVVEVEGELYVHEGDGVFVTASCWNSFSPSLTAVSSSRIV